MKHLLILSTIVLISAGCATQPKGWRMRVNAINSNKQADPHYVLLPGNQGVSTNDLQFLEFAEYTHKLLQRVGYIQENNINNACTAIFLSYGLADKSEGSYTHSTPVLGQTGVSSSYSSGTATTYGNTTHYSGTTSYMPTIGITGYNNRQVHYTMYNRFICLEAVDYELYRKSEEFKPIWNTTIWHRSIYKDVREIAPVLIAGLEDYISTNTEKTALFDFYENDPSLLYITSSTNSTNTTSKSGKGECLAPPPHTTGHAGPHPAVPADGSKKEPSSF